jgi:hypothetical protein
LSWISSKKTSPGALFHLATNRGDVGTDTTRESRTQTKEKQKEKEKKMTSLADAWGEKGPNRAAQFAQAQAAAAAQQEAYAQMMMQQHSQNQAIPQSMPPLPAYLPRAGVQPSFQPPVQSSQPTHDDLARFQETVLNRLDSLQNDVYKPMRRAHVETSPDDPRDASNTMFSKWAPLVIGLLVIGFLVFVYCQVRQLSNLRSAVEKLAVSRITIDQAIPLLEAMKWKQKKQVEQKKTTLGHDIYFFPTSLFPWLDQLGHHFIQCRQGQLLFLAEDVWELV